MENFTFDSAKYKDFKIYRRRYIPNECIPLNSDLIYYISNELILTKWTTIKPRNDIGFGFSAYYKNLGIKVSKFFSPENKFLYWYNDISELSFNGKDINFTDLLIDVVIYPDLSYKVIDLDEFATAIKEGFITKEQEIRALTSLNHLLNLIYNNEYKNLQSPILELENFTEKIYNQGHILSF